MFNKKHNIMKLKSLLSVLLFTLALATTVNAQNVGGKLVRGDGAPRVWWISADNTTMHWVNSPAALTKYWAWSDVKVIPIKDLPALAIGANVTATTSPKAAKALPWGSAPSNPAGGKLIQRPGEAAVWFVDANNTLHWVTSPAVLTKYWSWGQVVKVAEKDYRNEAIGKNITQ